MRSKFRNLMVIALCLMSVSTMAKAAPSAKFKVAVTMDDLTVHGSIPEGMTRQDIGQITLSALKAHHVPKVWGFVNAKTLEAEPGSVAMLKLWHDTGYPLGNHTYAHASLDQLTITEFEDEVVRGEAPLIRYNGTEDYRTFRFPFLNSGNATNHEASLKFLKDRNYQIADVTMSFDDWAYSEAYARCSRKGDKAAMQALKVRFLEGVDIQIKRAQMVSQRVYGRQIPHVLLTHIGGFTAILWEEVLIRLEGAGAEYITLEEAQSDPAYVEGANYAQGMMMERDARTKSIDLSGIPTMPVIGDLNTVCQ